MEKLDYFQTHTLLLQKKFRKAKRAIWEDMHIEFDGEAFYRYNNNLVGQRFFIAKDDQFANDWIAYN